jgi:hypothetical protein
MNGWAKLASTEAAEKAEAMLNRMIQRSTAEKKNMNAVGSRKKRYQVVRPDTVVFNACINGWATSRDPRAGQKALELLDTMNELSATGDDEHDTSPDIITYNTVLTCLSRCGDKNAGPKAEKIVKDFEKMQQVEDLDRAPVIQPNTITYNTVLHCWAQSKLSYAASRAEKILEYMIQSKNPTIGPDAYSFNCVMDALAKSKEPNKGLRSREWLDRLSDLHQSTHNPALKPTQIQYNTVLNACAFSSIGTPVEEQRQALEIAVKTFTSMSPLSTVRSRSSRNTNVVVRDTITYGNMMKCFANLIPKDDTRSRMALQVFQECCSEGLVGNLVWNEVRRSVPPKLLQDATQVNGHVGSMDVADLPKSWWENNQHDKVVIPKTTTTTTTRSGGTTNRSRGEGNSNTKKKSQQNPTKAPPKKRVFIVEQSFASDKDM